MSDETPVPMQAVVELGSLSTKLLITDGATRIRRSVDTFLGGPSLSAGGEPVTQAFSADTLDRVARVLGEFQAEIAARGASVQAIATAPARTASNRTALEALVADKLGVTLEVLDAADECVLGHVGGSSGLDVGSGAVVTLDVGGASTEFGVGDGRTVGGGWSMPIGASVISAAYLKSDPPRPEELSAALSVVELHIDDLNRELPAVAQAIGDSEATVVGLGGIVTIAAIEVGLPDADPLNGDGDGPLHGFVLEREAVEDVFRTIATESRADRLFNPGLPVSRVDSVVGGCVVLVEVLRQLGIDQLLVSQRGVADGVVARVTS